MKKILSLANLSRRTFLKGIGTLAGSAGLIGCSKNDENYIISASGDNDAESAQVVEQTYNAICRSNCQSNCALTVHTRNGRIVRTSKGKYAPEGGIEYQYDNTTKYLTESQLDEYYRKYERICLRGLTHVQRIYSTERLQTPLIRRNGERGDVSSFEAISWDEAIELIADKIAAVYDASDPQVLGRKFLTFIGSGNYGNLQGLGGAQIMLGDVLNSSHVWTGYDMSLPVGLSKVMGWQTFPFVTGNELRDIKNAKNLILWGSNMAEAHMVGWGFVCDARKENGGNVENVISIDVMANSTAVRSDYLYCVRPGSDTMVAMSMINDIITRGLYDEAFMIENTDAPLLIYEKADGTYAYLRNKDMVSNGDNSFAAWSVTDNGIAYTTNTGKSFAPIPVSDIYATNTRLELNYAKQYELENSAGYSLTLHDGTSITAKTVFQHLKEKTALYTPEYAETYTNISAINLRALVDMYVDGPSTIYLGFGTSHHYNSHKFGQAIAILGSITGNLCREGASIGNFFNRFTTRPTGNFANYPSRSRYLTHEFPPELAKKMRAGTSDIEVIMVAGTNPVSNNVNSKQDYIDTIFNKNYSDFIFTLDMTMTETAMYSDLVLPICHWFETEDQLSGSKHSFAMYQEKVAEPMFESKSDMDVVRLIAAKLMTKIPSVKTKFENLLMVNGRFKTNWELIADKMTGAESRVSAENLKRHKNVKMPPISKTYICNEVVNVTNPNNITSVSGTRTSASKAITSGVTGRFEIFCEYPMVFVEAIVKYDPQYFNSGTLINAGNFSQAGIDLIKKEQFIEWMEPSESWSGPTSDTVQQQRQQNYPLILMTEHTRWRVHTQWSKVPWLRELDPEPTLKLSPQDAATYGNIQTGDMVKISNERGHATLRAIITPALPVGMINVPKGWQRFYFTGETYADGVMGSYNDMTNPAYHPLSTDHAFFDARVKIEKI